MALIPFSDELPNLRPSNWKTRTPSLASAGSEGARSETRKKPPPQPHQPKSPQGAWHSHGGGKVGSHCAVAARPHDEHGRRIGDQPYADGRSRCRTRKAGRHTKFFKRTSARKSRRVPGESTNSTASAPRGRPVRGVHLLRGKRLPAQPRAIRRSGRISANWKWTGTTISIFCRGRWRKYPLT